MIFERYTDTEIKFHHDMARQHWQRQLRRLVTLSKAYQELGDELHRRGLS